MFRVNHLNRTQFSSTNVSVFLKNVHARLSMRGDSVAADCGLGVRLWSQHAQALVEWCRTDMTGVRARTQKGPLGEASGPDTPHILETNINISRDSAGIAVQ